MLKTFKEYFKDVVVWWWVVVIGTVLGGIQFFISVLAQGDSQKSLAIPIWIWISLAVFGFLIANFLAYHRMRIQRDIEKFSKQTEIIAQFEEKKRLERIELRKPYLETLSNVLFNIETHMNNLANSISEEPISERKSFEELSYYTSRIKNRSENDKKMDEYNSDLRKIKNQIADPVLTKLLNDYFPALYETKAHKCYSMYLQKNSKLTLDQKHNANKVDALLQQALDSLLAQIGKRKEELLMGIEIKSEH